MNQKVSLVIVSHSELIARGTAEMVHQMVGDEVVVVPCGGDPEGGLGTDVMKIKEAIESAYSDKGVLVLVDLGGAETNSEMALEMLPREQQPNVRICDAPIVEGAIMAGVEASSGANLTEVFDTAEEYLA